MDPWSDVGLSLNPATRDRHAYVNYNPVGMVDPWGHCGTGGSSGPEAEDSCAVGVGEYCKDKPPGAPYCPAGQTVSQEQAQGHQDNIATGGKPGSSYETGPQASGMPNVVTTVKRGPSIVSLKNPLTNFAIGDQVACGQNLGFNTTCGIAFLTLFKPAKFGELAYDARRGTDALDNARDAKRATSGDAGSIADGHAFEKHVVRRGEFPGIRARAEFAEMIQGVMTNGTSRTLSNGRTAYWDRGVVVIRNPNAVDGGTAFVPRNGIDYFNGLG